MALIARIIVVSLLVGVLGAGIGGALSVGFGVSLILACVGSLIGAAAGTTQEIVTALRQRPFEPSKPFTANEAEF